jgi:hypothetical protein
MENLVHNEPTVTAKYYGILNASYLFIYLWFL